MAADIYETKEATIRALMHAGVRDPQAIWARTLEAAMAKLPAWVADLAFTEAALVRVQGRALRSDNTTGAAGIDRHRGRFRARVWAGGKIVYCRCFRDFEAAITGRAKFLAGQR